MNEREGGYAVSLPARDNVRVDLRGPGRVNVSQILYDPQGNTVGYRTAVRNDVVQRALEQAGSDEDRAQILEFFNAYRDRVVTADDPEFEAINLSVVNDDKVAGRLHYVPAKISVTSGMYTDGLNQTGIALEALQALQARQQAAEMLPEELR